MGDRAPRLPAPPAGGIVAEQRPPLSTALSAAELRRWYWLKSELQELARQLGVRASGGKVELAARVEAALDGRPAPSGGTRQRAPSRAVSLTGELTPETLVPEGQRCSQHLRAFFVEQIGSTFRFDATMRQWVARAAGRPLAEGVELWHRSRDAPRPQIAPQFELNRFLRAWHEAHPGTAMATP